MKALNQRPDVKEKRAAFLASDRAPFKQPEGRHKLIENQRVKGFPNLRYDGGPTVPQKMLFDALPGGVMEFSFLKSRRFRVDLAFPSLRLAIEVDGLSHFKQKEKDRDARKEQILKERGWTLLRFRNPEITGDLASVLAQIQGTMVKIREIA